MSFRDCIQTAIDTGRVSAKKGQEALDAYDEAFERADGEPEGIRDTMAANAALEDITTLKAAKRHERIAVMQRSHEIYTRLMGAKNPARELQNIVVDMEMAQETVRSLAFANLDTLMLKFEPKVAGLVQPKAGMDDIVRAAYGEGGTPEAKELADAVIQVREDLRKEANMYGASIPENANAKLMQMHDSVRVRAVEQDEWVTDHLNNLDWEVMRFEGKEVPVDQRQEILERTYQGIVNDGFDRGNVAQLHSPSLGNRLNRDRFLYYKNADSYLAMQKKYGAGNFYEQTINMVEVLSKDISILKLFGPQADSMKEFTKRVAGKRAADLNNERPAGKKDVVKNMEKQLQLFEDEYRIHAWHVVSSDGNLPVQTFATIRTVAVNALLGASFIPNLFGDLGNASQMRHVLRMPEVSVFRSYSKEFLASKRARAEAAQLGVIMETAISLTQGRVRYFGALDGPYIARRFADASYRLGLANHHTQVIRNAQGKQLLGLWANYSQTQFDDLPFAAFLIERGITKEDWDAFRATPLKDIRGAKFLVPLDMWRTGDEGAKKTAEKFMAAMQLFIRTQVPDVTLRSRRALGEFVDPNSAAGQSIRTLGSLFAFPVGIWFNQLQRIAEAPGIRNKIVFGARYATAMTIAGLAIEQARAIKDGKELHDVTAADTWGRAAIAGGALGIVGDLVLNSLNMSNSARGYSNPTMEWLDRVRQLFVGNAWQAAFGEDAPTVKDVTADLAKVIDATVPDLWYSKLIFERAIKDDFMRWVDPAGWSRKQKYLKEHDEGAWWGPGEDPQAPDLATAIGE